MSTPILDQVIDLSHHNVVTDFKKVQKSGVVGIIHKATQGITTVDKDFAARVSPIRTSGMMHGAYHFGIGADGVIQARHFLATVKPDDRTLLALDFEPNTRGGTMTLAQAKAFVTYVHQQTGRWPLLYSGHLVKDLLGQTRDATLAKCGLWLAQYGPKAVIQPTWAKWTLWQYTESGTVPGITGDVDRNYFAGNPNDLRALFGYPPLSK